jgi:hypothetical protein
MAENTGSNEGSAAARRTHCRQKHSIDNLLERFLFIFVLIPSSLVQELPEKFNGRLRTILFLGGHVQIVDEEHTSALGFGTILTLTNLIQFAVYDVLGHHGGSLGREAKFNAHELIGREFVEDIVLDVDGLARSGGSAEEHRDFVVDVYLQQLLVAHCVVGLHDDLLWESGFADLLVEVDVVGP